MKVVKIDLNDNIYGGRKYEEDVIKYTSDSIQYKRIRIIKHKFKLLNSFRLVKLFIFYRYFSKDILFLNDHTTWLMGKKAKKNIVLIHHKDSSYSPRLSKIYQSFCHLFLKINQNRISSFITVSKYWKNYFESQGFNNIRVIYNAIELNDVLPTEEEKQEFLKKYNLIGKELIYIGNALKKKGTEEVFNVLKNSGYTLITSGKNMLNLPCLHINGSYKEYITLLSVCKFVITMSKFNEGWNRTAHEAILCGTHVIGNGRGGMKELLEMEKQTICSKVEDLPRFVNQDLIPFSATKIQEFNFNYLRNQWLKVFNN